MMDDRTARLMRAAECFLGNSERFCGRMGLESIRELVQAVRQEVVCTPPTKLKLAFSGTSAEALNGGRRSGIQGRCVEMAVAHERMVSGIG